MNTQNHSLACLSTVVLILAMVTVPATGQTTWTAGSGDFFTASNWDNGVPILTEDAFINNGGSATAESGGITGLNLNIGTDGGSGTLNMNSIFDTLTVEQSLNIGYTSSGSASSTGTFNVIDGLNPIEGSGSGILRIGVTDAAGDATGDFGGRNFDSGTVLFDSLQVGVSNGTGTASGTIGFFIADESFNDIDIGVANDAGDASGTITDWFVIRGADATNGVANIGVSNGSGSADGSVINGLGTGAFTGWDVVNIGVATAGGNATGHLLLPTNGGSFTTLNLGLSSGSGTGTGTFELVSGFGDIDQINMGDGATLQLGLSGTGRGGSYAAIDVDNATLDGNLVASFYDLSTVLQFELINSSSATGISGFFDNVTIENLNQGHSASVSVVTDSGVEKVILDITGTLVSPEWTNTTTGGSAGDWFDSSNWSSSLIPGLGDPAFVNNGGEAVADGGTALGDMEALALTIGSDGGTGSLTSDTVNLTATRAILIGYASDAATGGTATGTATFTDADLTVLTPIDDDQDEGRILVGFAQGSGTGDGMLIMNGGNLTAKNGILFGYARPEPGADAVAIADVQFAGDGIGGSVIEGGDGTVIDIGSIDAFEENVSAVTNAAFSFADATILDSINIAEVSNRDPNSDSDATADGTFTNVVIEGDIDIALVEADSPSTASGDATVELTDVTFDTSAGFSSSLAWFDAEAADADSFATSSGSVTANGFSHTTDGDFEFGFADANGDDVNATTTATTNASLTGSDFTLSIDQFEFADVDTDDLGVGNATVIGELSDSVINARTLEVGRADAVDGATAILEASLTLTDSEFTITESSFVGSFEGDTASADNNAVVALTLIGSTLTSPTLDVGATNEPGSPLDATLNLNPSYVSTDLLTVGEDGNVSFTLTGLERVTETSVGESDTYSAIDAVDALLAGTIVVEFDFTPEAGTHIFDLIITDSETALDDATMSPEDFQVNGLNAGFTVDSFGIVEDGTDIVRLQISGSPVLLGDVNLDGVVDLLDVAPFVDLLSDGLFQIEADINQDGVVNLLDIAPFVDFTERFVVKGLPLVALSRPASIEAGRDF